MEYKEITSLTNASFRVCFCDSTNKENAKIVSKLVLCLTQVI